MSLCQLSDGCESEKERKKKSPFTENCKAQEQNDQEKPTKRLLSSSKRIILTNDCKNDHRDSIDVCDQLIQTAPPSEEFGQDVRSRSNGKVHEHQFVQRQP